MSATLDMKLAREIIAANITEEHLIIHSLSVSAAMRSMAELLGGDAEHWAAVGYLHDVDFERYPSEHCSHVNELLSPYDISDEDIHAVKSHGWGLCSDVEPITPMEKALFTVDELTGIVYTTALMRPTKISDLEVKSIIKKFKDKKFAAKCDREVILKGCGMLGMTLEDVTAAVVAGMKADADALKLGI